MRSFEKLATRNRGGIRSSKYGNPLCSAEHGSHLQRQCLFVDGLFLDCCPGNSSTCKENCLIKLTGTLHEMCDRSDYYENKYCIYQADNTILKKRVRDQEIEIDKLKNRPVKKVTFENSICLTLAQQEAIAKFGERLTKMVLNQPKTIKPYYVTFDFVFYSLPTLEQKKYLVDCINQSDAWINQFKRFVLKSIKDYILTTREAEIPYDTLQFLHDGIQFMEKEIIREEETMIC